jgi:hypothetical protein
MDPESGTATAPRLSQSAEQFELAFEQAMAAERRRRMQLRQRAVNRSRARRIARTESRGRVRFSVLFVALAFTVITVVFVMFETLAWLMSPA